LLLVILSVVFALTVVSFFVVRPVKAEDGIIKTEITASIRLDIDGDKDVTGEEHLGKDGKNGIKFVGYVSKSVGLNQANADTNKFSATDVYSGIMVAKGEYTAEEMEALPMDDKLDIPAVKMDPANNTDTHRAFNAVVYGAPSSEYKTKLTAVAYLHNADGSYTYAAETCTRSILEVASSSLLEDGLPLEDVETLKAFVDYANHVVKLGDTVLSHDSTNNITLTGGDTLPIIVEPAGVAYKASIVAGGAIQITNDVISVKTIQAEVQKVVINVLGTEYTVDITLKEWHGEVNGNVIADFSNSNSVYSVQDGNDKVEGTNTAITWLDPATALSETGRESGMLKVNAGGGDVTQYTFPTPIDVATTNGVYIKFKMPAALEEDANDEINGVMYVSVNNGKSAALNNQLFRNYVSADGEWNTIVISKNDLADYFGLYAGKFTSIYFMPVYAASVFYIDEIGILETPAEDWGDTDLAEGVFADFNEAGYLNTISTWANREKYNVGKLTYLDAETAKAEAGADSGVIKLQAVNTYSRLRIYLQEPIYINKIAGFSFRLKSPAPDKANLMVILPGVETINENRPCYVHSHSGASTEVGYVANEWFDVEFTMSSYSVDTWGDWAKAKEPIEYLEIKVNHTTGLGAWYFDEISLLHDSAEGYLNDFNEDHDVSYAKGHPSWHKEGFSIVHGVEGAEGGVLQINTITQGLPFTIFPQRHVDGSKVSKIIVRLLAPATEISQTSDIYVNGLVKLSVNTTATANTMSETSQLKGGKWHNFNAETSSDNIVFKRGQWVDVEFNVAGKLSARGIDAMMFTQNYSGTVAKPNAWKAVKPADEAPWLVDSIKYVLA
jgi:hypothetical protein